MDPHLGNALGTDCLVVGTIERQGREQLLSFYEGDGLENEDYFGWRQALLAPFDGVVASVRPPAEPNRPGVLPEDPAEGGRIEFRRHDGARVIYVHVREIAVQAGDSVSAGDPLPASKETPNGASSATTLRWISGTLESRPLGIPIRAVGPIAVGSRHSPARGSRRSGPRE